MYDGGRSFLWKTVFIVCCELISKELRHFIRHDFERGDNERKEEN